VTFRNFGCIKRKWHCVKNESCKVIRKSVTNIPVNRRCDLLFNEEIKKINKNTFWETIIFHWLFKNSYLAYRQLCTKCASKKRIESKIAFTRHDTHIVTSMRRKRSETWRNTSTRSRKKSGLTLSNPLRNEKKSHLVLSNWD